MTRRTKIYLVAEWDGDRNAIEQLHKWNDSNFWSLSFTDAHDITQARDGSLNCSIKTSLNTRIDASKTFVLIVGSNTKTARNGSCQYCGSYNAYQSRCVRGKTVSYSSYIEHECAKAVRDNLKIVVLYNAASIDKNKCPEVIRYSGTHKAMQYIENSKRYWDYNAVKDAITN
ncbi:TIR domain-containing protein [Photobacterium damselae]|uniref:TIR domain-containing protein n=7 Tax=Vibrionaceae TaxID=641 RepID=UPI0035E44957